MKLVRLAVLLVCLVQVTAGCGCPADRQPSRIRMALPTAPSADAYSVDICIDPADAVTEPLTCETFNVAPGDVAASLDGRAELELIPTGELNYISWRPIAPGTYAVSVSISDENGMVATSVGTVPFERIDRCHAEDSKAVIDLVATR